MDTAKLLEELRRDEGLRTKPYRCTAGKLTIGIGRNLDDVGITVPEALELARHDVERVVLDLNRALPWWKELPGDARQRVLVNMGFNLGVPGLLEFRNTLGLVKAGRYTEAAGAMLASKWARQVGPRAVRLAAMMRTGTTEGREP
jgi:lysozyme